MNSRLRIWIRTNWKVTSISCRRILGGIKWGSRMVSSKPGITKFAGSLKRELLRSGIFKQVKSNYIYTAYKIIGTNYKMEFIESSIESYSEIRWFKKRMLKDKPRYLFIEHAQFMKEFTDEMNELPDYIREEFVLNLHIFNP